jgi:hypothetical protein
MLEMLNAKIYRGPAQICADLLEIRIDKKKSNEHGR